MNPGPAAPGSWRLPRRFHFIRHCGVFAAFAVLVLGARQLTGSDWPLFWPIAGWTSILVLHYFVASSYDLDGDWIDDRVTELRSRSYDFDHIRNIEHRIKKGDTSVTPQTERGRNPGTQ